jgi:hypothetical protein
MSEEPDTANGRVSKDRYRQPTRSKERTRQLWSSPMRRFKRGISVAASLTTEWHLCGTLPAQSSASPQPIFAYIISDGPVATQCLANSPKGIREVRMLAGLWLSSSPSDLTLLPPSGRARHKCHPIHTRPITTKINQFFRCCRCRGKCGNRTGILKMQPTRQIARKCETGMRAVYRESNMLTIGKNLTGKPLDKYSISFAEFRFDRRNKSSAIYE